MTNTEKTNWTKLLGPKLHDCTVAAFLQLMTEKKTTTRAPMTATLAKEIFQLAGHPDRWESLQLSAAMTDLDLLRPELSRPGQSQVSRLAALVRDYNQTSQGLPFVRLKTQYVHRKNGKILLDAAFSELPMTAVAALIRQNPSWPIGRSLGCWEKYLHALSGRAFNPADTVAMVMDKAANWMFAGGTTPADRRLMGYFLDSLHRVGWNYTRNNPPGLEGAEMATTLPTPVSEEDPEDDPSLPDKWPVPSIKKVKPRPVLKPPLTPREPTQPAETTSPAPSSPAREVVFIPTPPESTSPKPEVLETPEIRPEDMQVSLPWYLVFKLLAFPTSAEQQQELLDGVLTRALSCRESPPNCVILELVARLRKSLLAARR